MADSDLEYRVGKLELQEGDFLVVKLGEHSRPSNYSSLQRILPAGVKVLIIPHDVDLSVLRKTDAADG